MDAVRSAHKIQDGIECVVIVQTLHAFLLGTPRKAEQLIDQLLKYRSKYPSEVIGIGDCVEKLRAVLSEVGKQPREHGDGCY